MLDRVDGLIDVLFDNTAREDERHDAAMDIGKYDDDRALSALLQLASNLNEDDLILDACGESIAQILVNRNYFSQDMINKLAPTAREMAEAYIKEHKPEWLMT